MGSEEAKMKQQRSSFSCRHRNLVLVIFSVSAFNLVNVVHYSSKIPLFQEGEELVPAYIDNDIHSKSKSDNNERTKIRVNNRGGFQNDWLRGRDTNTSRFLSHPHQGVNINGTPGWIVDPSPSRLEVIFDGNNDNTSTTTSRSSQIINAFVDRSVLCPKDDGYAVEGIGGKKVLQKIKNGLIKSIKFMSSTNSINNVLENNSGIDVNNTNRSTQYDVRRRRSKILCLVYTVHFQDDNHTNLRSQAHTWGRRCDGFIAASNYTDHSIGAVDLLHQGNEEYSNMWQKIRSIWAYAYNHYINEFDFFYICGDDTYVAVENLRSYLDGPEIERLENGHVDRILNRFRDRSKNWDMKRPRPLLLGTPVIHKNCPNPDGGSGYVMNRAALELFGAGLSSYATNVSDSREDVYIGSFFCSQGMFLSDTQSAIDGGWRFSYGAETSYIYDGRSPINPKYLNEKFGYEIKKGMDSVSESQISFHFKSEKKRVTNHGFKISDLMYRYEATLYNLCDSP